MENKMFCYQCQETANCTGCTLTGVCGKNPQVAAAQDLLVYVTKGYCEVTTKLRKEGTNISDAKNRMVVMNLFMTITNANFDKEAIENRIHDTLLFLKSAPLIPLPSGYYPMSLPELPV